MREVPLIVRVVLAENWLAAYRILFVATFGRLSADRAEMMTYIKWPERRRLCGSFADQCIGEANDEELARAWHCLADDPCGPGLYRLVFCTVGAAIVADPTLIDDDAFAKAVAGWRSLATAGQSGQPDFIAAARARGATLTVEKAEMLAWSRLWAEGRP